MTIPRNRQKKIIPILAIFLIFLAAIPANVVHASAAPVAAVDPESVRMPAVYDPAYEGIDALREHITSLEKIIELNVKRADKVPVLLYHHLVKEIEMTESQRKNDSIMSVEQFSLQMAYLYENNYYTASLYELERFMDGKMLLPERTVVITFDDGYRSNTKYAYPILKKYDFKAAVFVITGLIGEKENVIEHANWSDLKKCGDVFSYHSHSHNLHKQQQDGKGGFASNSTPVIAEDLLISKALLSTAYIAYPYGQTSRAVKKALLDAGFRMGFTTVAEYAKRKGDFTEIPRFTITPNIDADTFDVICSGRASAAPPAAPEAPAQTPESTPAVVQ